MYLFIPIKRYQIKVFTIASQLASQFGKKLHISMSQKYFTKYFYGMLQCNDSMKLIPVCCGIVPWNMSTEYFYEINSSIPWNHIPWNIGIPSAPCGIFQHSFRHPAEWNGTDLQRKDDMVRYLRIFLCLPANFKTDGIKVLYASQKQRSTIY